jgi:hypothetical protein
VSININSWAISRLSYYSECLEASDSPFSLSFEIGEFPSFRAWNGATFSKHYITTLLDRYYNDEIVLRGRNGDDLTRSLFHHRSLQQGLAIVTAGDATFKFIKSVRISGERGASSKAESLYSILNERNEVFDPLKLTIRLFLLRP